MDANGLRLTVKKTPGEREWVARVTRHGKLLASYYGSNKQDAEVTGRKMLVHERETEQGKVVS